MYSIKDELLVSNLKFFNKEYKELSEYDDDNFLLKYNPLTYSVITKDGHVIFQRYSLINNEYLKNKNEYKHLQQEINKNLNNKNNINLAELDLSEAKEILYDLQFEVFKKILKSGYGIIKLNTGFGKTVIASTLIKTVHKPSLFIVDNTILKKQFIDTVNKFFKCKVNELRDDKRIRNKLKELNEKDYYDENEIFWVTTVQFLYRKIKDKTFNKILERRDLYDVFKIVIYDEAHTTGGAKMFSKSSILFKTKNLFGLTATPYNSGINKILLFSAFSDNIISLNTQDEGKLTENLYGIIQTFYTANEKYPKNPEGMMYYIYQKKLSQDNNFILAIIKRLKTILKNEKRNILILTKQIDTAERLKKNIEKFFNINVDFLYSKNKKLKHDSNIIISTIDFGKKGLDIPKINYIINTVPVRSKNSLYQIIGRALRIYRNEDGQIIDKPNIIYEEIIPEIYKKKFVFNKDYIRDVLKPKYGNIKVKILNLK